MPLTIGTPLAHSDLPADTAAIDNAANKAQILAAIGAMANTEFVPRYGAGVPDNGLGEDEEYYVNILTGVIYHKTDGAWAALTPGTAPQAVLLVTSTPNAQTGNNGDVAIQYDSVNKLAVAIWLKAAGAWTAFVAEFARNMYLGTSAPDVNAGKIGDVYLLYDDGTDLPTSIYEKTGAATWTLRGDFPVSDVTEETVTASIAAYLATNTVRTRQLVPVDPVATGTGAVNYFTTANSVDCRINTSAGDSAFSRTVLAKYPVLASGADPTHFAQPMALDLSCVFSVTHGNTALCRVVFGEIGGSTGNVPKFADQDALETYGFGFEVGYNGTHMDIQLFCHNGSYHVSGWLDQNIFTAGKVNSIRLLSDGAGNISLYVAQGGQQMGAPAIPASPVLTLATGPTAAGNINANCISALAVSSTTGTNASASAKIHVMNSHLTLL